MEICSKCYIEKDSSMFSKSSRRKSGLKSACKKCASLDGKLYREANKDKLSAKSNAYYMKNKEKIHKYGKKYRENNAEKITLKNKKYQEENKEGILAIGKAYRENNKDKIADSQKTYAMKNKEKTAKRGKLYRENHKEDLIIKRKLYKASENGRVVSNRNRAERRLQIRETRDGSITSEALRELMIEQEGYCALCNCDLTQLKKKNQHVDHIIPLSKGGKHIIENIQWTCATCNLTKGNSMPLRRQLWKL